MDMGIRGRKRFARRSWREAFINLRNRLLASPTFQRRATAFPLTRPIARRRTRELFDLCAGFVYSQVLLACVRLGLCEILFERAHSVSELSERLEMSPEATLRLLKAATSLKLTVSLGSDRYGLGPLGAALVGNPGVRQMIQHHAMLYADLEDPVALLKGDVGDTQLSRYWSYARSDEPKTLGDSTVAAYSELMAASQPMVAEEVVRAYAFDCHNCLLDVGGGEGVFLSAVARAAPLRLVLFDLPAVAERAKTRFDASGFAARTTVVGGDFLTDSLPDGADIISLIRILHDHEDAAVLALLKAAKKALPENGTLLIAEPMSGTKGGGPIGDAYFGMYLLAMGQGRARTPQEIQRLATVAGFRNFRQIPTANPLIASLMTARS